MIKQFHKNRQNETAQALIFVIITAFVLISFIIFVLNTGTIIGHKIKMQTAADASAISGAAWQARALNMIAILNFGITACCAAITVMVAAIGVSLGELLPVLGPYITKMYRAARQMAKVQDIIIKTNPFFVEAETFRIAKINGIKGAVAIAPEIAPWPKLHIHRFGKPESFNPGTTWKEDNDTERYHPSDENINTLIPTPYVRDSDFDAKQYVFTIAVDEPSEIFRLGKKFFKTKSPALVSLPEIKIANYTLVGDIGYIAVSQAKPVNRKEPSPFLLIPEWEVTLTPVTAPSDVSVPGLAKLAETVQEKLICH